MPRPAARPQLDLLANAVVGVVRAATAEPEPLPEALDRQIKALSVALDRLAATEQPWPPAVREEVARIAQQATDYARPVRGERGATTTAILGATGADLSLLLEPRS
jgi:hypothetical protein